MSNTKHSFSRGHVAALLATAISLVIACVLVVNRQQVIDQIAVWQYQPTEQVQTLATSSGMSENGTFYFYASQPSLETAQTFSDKCGKTESSTAILGCYSAQRIFIYNVTDERLSGVRSVTAAHEMLHAVYERLGGTERERVDALLIEEYEKLKNDEKFEERMKFYDRTEPGQRNNELHSLVATEVKSISPELETYFKAYFTDRSKVVALHAAYDKVFTKLQARADELAANLKALRTAIENDTAAYNNDVLRFNQDMERFNERARSGDFDSQAQFDRERGVLLARTDALDLFRDSIQSDIKDYSAIQDELATVASQSQELNRSINSSLAPAPSL